jgi:hypothetical protein
MLSHPTPILYDLGIVGGVNPPDPSSGTPSYESLEAARFALGDTVRYSQRTSLAEMTPRGDLSPTGYVLANPGQEYLVLQPSDATDPFSVTVAAGSYAVEWYSVTSRETRGADNLTVEWDGSVDFRAPFAEAGPAVLYLKRV